MSNPPSSPPAKSSFAPYRQALQALSVRTGTPLPSLVVSFAVLHELTALLPLAGFFFGARALGIGERVVNAVQIKTASELDAQDNWAKAKGREWVNEGSVWAQKVGRRYGVFGYEKRKPGEPSSVDEDIASSDPAGGGDMTARLAGDAANAIVAYGMTKALVPVRIGLSLYLSPAFSRRIVDPIRVGVASLFRRRP